MSSSNDQLLAMIPAWVEATRDAEIPIGLSANEALSRASRLRLLLRERKVVPVEFEASAELAETLHALCAILSQRTRMPAKALLQDAKAAFGLISSLNWSEAGIGGMDDLISDCAFLCWRYARRAGSFAAEHEWRERYAHVSERSAAGFAVESMLATPIAERIPASPTEKRFSEAVELCLDRPETVLALLARLFELASVSPERVLAEARFLHDFLRGLEIRDPIDPILYDEREYFLGDAARIAGTMCRELSRREEARHWFDRAEGWYIHTENCAGNLLKLRYQRLALKVEEREFASVLELVPQVIWGFEKLGMLNDALKARILEAVVLKEADQTSEALVAFGRIVEEAQRIGAENLLASAHVSLSQLHAFLGQAEEAMTHANQATPILRRLGNKIDLAKLQWGIGHLLRSQGKAVEAIEAFRASQTRFGEIGLLAHAAGIHLIVADLLLDAGQEARAEWEIRAALPVIDELGLVPEGVAALSLLRESMRGRRIDRKALRELHGYFPES